MRLPTESVLRPSTMISRHFQESKFAMTQPEKGGLEFSGAEDPPENGL